MPAGSQSDRHLALGHALDCRVEPNRRRCRRRAIRGPQICIVLGLVLAALQQTAQLFLSPRPTFWQDFDTSQILTWKLCRKLSKDVLSDTLEAARVHRAEATATGWFRRWEDDVEFCRSRWVLSTSQGLGVLSMGAPAALAYETWAPGQSNLVRWINLIVGLQEKDIHNHPQMSHHDISNAVHLSTFLKTGA